MFAIRVCRGFASTISLTRVAARSHNVARVPSARASRPPQLLSQAVGPTRSTVRCSAILPRRSYSIAAPSPHSDSDHSSTASRELTAITVRNNSARSAIFATASILGAAALLIFQLFDDESVFAASPAASAAGPIRAGVWREGLPV